MKHLSFGAVFTILIAAPIFASDLETIKKKGTEMVTELKNDTGRAAKDLSRKAKEQKCKLENKNMDCLGMKAKHAIQKGADEIEDALD